MSKPRRRPNMTERLAACLCELRRGDDWLIPEHLRLHGSAREICAWPEWDHATPFAWTADNRPQNLTPMAPAAHREKTRRDVKEIARVRRGLKKRSGAKRKSHPMPGSDNDLIEALKMGEPGWERNQAPKLKRPMQYTAMKATHKRTFAGKVVPR